MERAPLVVSAEGPERLAAIDALRGLAISGVVLTHLGALFADASWRANRLAGVGAHGVHLFFVLSALTMMLSWNSRRGGVWAFYVRRLFRIAPLYWLGIVFYGCLHLVLARLGMHAAVDAEGIFDGRAVLLTAMFANGFSPERINAVVPGGWTIVVEMMFYAIFPLLAVSVTTRARAAVLLVVSVLLAIGANLAAPALLGLGHEQLDQTFLYYWLPNSLPAFALGILAYHLLARAPRRRWASAGLVIAAVSLGVVVAFGPLPWQASLAQPISRGTAAAAASVCLVLAAWRVRRPLLVNRLSVALGRVSYSAYLMHWLILDAAVALLGPLDLPPGLGLLLRCMTLPMWLALTYVLASRSYRWVEQPGIRAGGRLLRWWARRATGGPA